MGRNEIDPDEGIASGDKFEVDIGILLPFLNDLYNFDMLHRISALERTGNDLRQRIDISTYIDRQQNDRTVASVFSNDPQEGKLWFSSQNIVDHQKTTQGNSPRDRKQPLGH